MAQVQTTKGAPRGAKREIEQKAGIGVRDLVTVAVFSVIYFIIFFACGCLGFVPVMAFLFPLPLALVSGIPQMLFYTKVRSFGMVTIMGALLGLLEQMNERGQLDALGSTRCLLYTSDDAVD